MTLNPHAKHSWNTIEEFVSSYLCYIYIYYLFVDLHNLGIFPDHQI